MTAAEVVHLDVDRGVATVTLDSPANRNALSRQLVSELDAHLATAMADPAVRAVVLTHTGPVFCAGADLKEQAQPAPAGAGRVPPLPAVLTRIMAGRAPVVAKLHGPARAGGLGLVAACDLSVAPPTATFAFTEVHLGLVPAIIAVPVVRRMRPGAARRWMLTGLPFDAAQAVTDGLLTLVADDVEAACNDLLAGFRAAEPTALAATKALIAEVAAADLEEGFAAAAAVSARFFASAPAQEGMAAFAAKRPPAWRL